MSTEEAATMVGVIDWLATGKRGISSETIALTALGHVPTGFRFGYPHDPSDLRRCVQLLDRAPVARKAFDVLSARCPVWRALIGEWDELVASLRRECAADRGIGERWYCPETYAAMRAVIDPVERFDH